MPFCQLTACFVNLCHQLIFVNLLIYQCAVLSTWCSVYFFTFFINLPLSQFFVLLIWRFAILKVLIWLLFKFMRHMLDISLTWRFINSVSYHSAFINVIFPTCYFINLLFLHLVVLSTHSLIKLLFCQLAVLLTICIVNLLFVNLLFCQFAVLSTCCFVNLMF